MGNDSIVAALKQRRSGSVRYTRYTRLSCLGFGLAQVGFLGAPSSPKQTPFTHFGPNSIGFICILGVIGLRFIEVGSG